MPAPTLSTRHSAFTVVTPTLPVRKASALRRLVAAVAAAATALSLIATTAAPARADSNDDMLKALIALGAVGIIAHEIDRKKDRDRRPARQDDWRQDEWPPRPHASTRIPSVCAIEIDGGRGRDGTVYSERCLRSEGVKARLPRDCAFEMRTRGRTDRMYSEHCLRQAGFRIGGRR